MTTTARHHANANNQCENPNRYQTPREANKTPKTSDDELIQAFSPSHDALSNTLAVTGVSGEFGARFEVEATVLERTDGVDETCPVVCGLLRAVRIRDPPEGQAEKDKAGQGELEDVQRARVKLTKQILTQQINTIPIPIPAPVSASSAPHHQKQTCGGTTWTANGRYNLAATAVSKNEIQTSSSVAQKLQSQTRTAPACGTTVKTHRVGDMRRRTGWRGDKALEWIGVGDALGRSEEDVSMRIPNRSSNGRTQEKGGNEEPKGHGEYRAFLLTIIPISVPPPFPHRLDAGGGRRSNHFSNHLELPRIISAPTHSLNHP
ncbi:hypothetical protein V490_01987 [Pseudogymnoascus sp. VKM F-3557]|nr:hypothetical protein V490_01987 [Pseudogymnoascus sp. VKM F-3557]